MTTHNLRVNDQVERNGRKYLVGSISDIGRTDAYGRFTKEGSEVVLMPVSKTQGFVITGPQLYEFYPEGA